MPIRILIVLLTFVLAGSLSAQPPAESRADQASAEPFLYVIIYRAGPAWRHGLPISEQGLQPHGAYIAQNFEQGSVRAAGPLGADGGIILLRAGDEVEARTFVEGDPAIIAGLFVAEIDRWYPRFRHEAPFDP